MRRISRLFRSAPFWTLAAALCLLLSIGLSALQHTEVVEGWQVSRVESAFRDADQQLRTSLANAAVLRCLNETGGRCAFAAGIQEQPGIVLLYQGDSLFYWSDHRVLVGPGLRNAQADEGFVRLANGYYLFRRAEHGQVLAIGLLPLRTDYAVENRYLTDRFADYLHVPEGAILQAADGAGFPVRDASGETQFRLLLDKQVAQVPWFLPWLCLVFLQIAMHRWSIRLGGRAEAVPGEAQHVVAVWRVWAPVLLFTGLAFAALRQGWWPQVWNEARFFDPHWFAAPGLAGSLGQLLLGLQVLLLPTATLWWASRPRRLLSTAPALQAGLLGLGLSGLVLALQWTCQRLVLDSVLRFDIHAFLQLDAVGLAAHLAIGWSLLLVLAQFRIWKEALRPYPWAVLLGMMLLPMLGLLCWKAGMLPTLTGLWTADATVNLQGISRGPTGYGLLWHALGVLGLWAWLRSTRQSQTALARILVLAGGAAIWTGLLLQQAGARREGEVLRRQAAELAEESDPIMEYLFTDAVRGIRNDPFVKGVFQRSGQGMAAAEEQIRTRHLGSYFDRYRMQSMFYDGAGLPLSPEGVLPQAHMDSLIEFDGRTTAAVGLYHMHGGPRAYYLARVAVPFQPGASGALYLRLERRPVRKNSVYPELLLRDQKGPEAAGYDWAVYRNQKLLESDGAFAFDLRLPQLWRQMVLAPNAPEYRTFDDQGRFWMLYRPRPGDVVVLSRPITSWTAPFSHSSYLFLFFLLLGGLMALPLWVLRSLSRRKGRRRENLRGRIQSLVILLIVFSFLVVGTVTVWHFSRQYQEYHQSRLLRKMSAVVSEIDYEARAEAAGERRVEHPAYPYEGGVRADLGALGEIHDIDLNLFDTTGSLLASSQPEIFGKGLLARVMEPRAWEALHDRGVSQWLQRERIGRLRYLSAYVPLRSDQGQPVAYLHMPYFAQAQNLRSDVAAFLVALVNVYLLLLVGGGLLALFISNSITRPLARVGAAFRKVQLGHRNEPIPWEGKDEIGILVGEYNKMLAELERSAALLARSERESAWREMAKQVAHEIKNPLTPMRLSVQHLQRALDAGDPRAEELSRRVSKTLLEQIDTLSTIATAFSNFAKMPTPKPEAVDLQVVLQGVVDLFGPSGDQDTEEGVADVELTVLPPQDAAGGHGVAVVLPTDPNAALSHLVWADREQLIRVFNNLVKNARQAMTGERPGRIEVRLQQRGNLLHVEVEDNGCGIPEEMKDRVFVPNFTTKGSGMGLGLAMSKNIIESAAGRIGFRSKAGQGTVFYVELPRYRPDS